jgi:hypothetical protein
MRLHELVAALSLSIDLGSASQRTTPAGND